MIHGRPVIASLEDDAGRLRHCGASHPCVAAPGPGRRTRPFLRRIEPPLAAPGRLGVAVSTSGQPHDQVRRFRDRSGGRAALGGARRARPSRPVGDPGSRASESGAKRRTPLTLGRTGLLRAVPDAPKAPGMSAGGADIPRAKRARNECCGAAHSNPQHAPLRICIRRQPPARPSFTAIALSCNQAFPIYPTRE